MYELMVKLHFAAAHKLRNYDGECARLHGHNWQVDVLVKGEKLNEAGMLIDFKVVKGFVKDILEPLDHEYLNDLPYFQTHNPSAEEIAKYIFEQLKDNIRFHGVVLDKVAIWETSSYCVTYHQGGENA